MESDEILKWVYGIIVFAIIFYIWDLFDKRRLKALRKEAKALNLNFDKPARDVTYNKHKDCYLFSEYSGSITYEMWTQLDDMEFIVFDHKYFEGASGNRRHVNQTVLSFENNKLRLPSFQLRPENIIHKVGQVFGYHDIDIDSFPVFSSRYLLRGENEEEIRKLFIPELIKFFESHNKLCVEVKNNMLVIYRKSKRYSPDELRKFVAEGKHLYDIFCHKI